MEEETEDTREEGTPYKVASNKQEKERSGKEGSGNKSRTRDLEVWLIAVRQPKKCAEGLVTRRIWHGVRVEFKGVSSGGQKTRRN